MQALGIVALAGEEAPRCVQLFGAAAHLYPNLTIIQSPHEREEAEVALNKARLALDEKVFQAAWAEGQALTRDAAFELAVHPAPVGDALSD
jgi:hypothetical protein